MSRNTGPYESIGGQCAECRSRELYRNVVNDLVICSDCGWKVSLAEFEQEHRK